MTANDVTTQAASPRHRSKQQDVKIIRRKGQRRQYISAHFTTSKTKSIAKARTCCDDTLDSFDDVLRELPTLKTDKDDMPTQKLSLRTTSQAESTVNCPRIFFGLKVDELSSDSDLSDVPEDIGPDPFFSDDDKLPPSVLRAIAAEKNSKGTYPGSDVRCKKNTTKRSPAISPYFPTVRHAHRPQFLATLPFPPLNHDGFGLMQEKLAHDPYRLLLATIFLNKTPGSRAMPIFYNLMDRYPSPQALADANVAHVTEIIHVLGFQNQRARKCVELAKVWVQRPPALGRRYRKLHYPVKGDGKDVKEEECIDDTDDRVAWEISHLPGLGPYSHDSWRMFCRDELRGLSEDWLGRGSQEADFEPEWKRVLPMDKELRAWMTWMWLKEGWLWNKETGERTKVDDELMKLASGGGIVQESVGKEHLIVQGLDNHQPQTQVRVETPAGSFMPQP